MGVYNGGEWTDSNLLPFPGQGYSLPLGPPSLIALPKLWLPWSELNTRPKSYQLFALPLSYKAKISAGNSFNVQPDLPQFGVEGENRTPYALLFRQALYH